MPNWCNNKLTITHKDADVMDNLMSQVRADENGDLFKYIKPMPDNTFRGALGNEEREECESKGIPNWYDWCCENWGTKWDACHMSWHQHDDHSVSFDFDTAWSPPISVYEELAEQGFEVEAYYVEYGMMFAGEWHCDGDGLFSDEFINDISEGVTPDLDEAFNITATLEEWKQEDEAYEEQQQNVGAIA